MKQSNFWAIAAAADHDGISALRKSFDRHTNSATQEVDLNKMYAAGQEHFYVNSYRGNLYGQAKLMSQIGPGAPRIRTEIKGLFHCGQSTNAHGVLGALATGVIAASKITNSDIDDLLQFAEGGSHLPPSDLKTSKTSLIL